MLLIGMLDSPFVRRVAVSMRLLGMSYERHDWSVGRDSDRIRPYNPLGRVPVLVLDSGEILIESGAILDHLDQEVGPNRALLPVAGTPRRRALQLMALAVGAAEKARDRIYEREFRPADKSHAPWAERLLGQMHGALAELERRTAAAGSEHWLIDDRFSQADITLTCCLSLITDALPLELLPRYPALSEHYQRCEALPEFLATKAGWFPPSTT
jgi:glutathione S-transferase